MQTTANSTGDSKLETLEFKERERLKQEDFGKETLGKETSKETELQLPNAHSFLADSARRRIALAGAEYLWKFCMNQKIDQYTSISLAKSSEHCAHEVEGHTKTIPGRKDGEFSENIVWITHIM